MPDWVSRRLHQATIGDQSLAGHPAAALQRLHHARQRRLGDGRALGDVPGLHPVPDPHNPHHDEAAPGQVVLPQHRVGDVRTNGVGGAVDARDRLRGSEVDLQPFDVAVHRRLGLGERAWVRHDHDGNPEIVCVRTSRPDLGDVTRPTAIDSSKPLDTIVWTRTIPRTRCPPRARHRQARRSHVCHQRRSSRRHRGGDRRQSWAAAHSALRTSCSSWSPRPHR